MMTVRELQIHYTYRRLKFSKLKRRRGSGMGFVEFKDMKTPRGTNVWNTAHAHLKHMKIWG